MAAGPDQSCRPGLPSTPLPSRRIRRPTSLPTSRSRPEQTRRDRWPTRAPGVRSGGSHASCGWSTAPAAQWKLPAPVLRPRTAALVPPAAATFAKAERGRARPAESRRQDATEFPPKPPPRTMSTPARRIGPSSDASNPATAASSPTATKKMLSVSASGATV